MIDIDIKKEKNIFFDLLNNSKKILLINHRRMDWDAFWSLSWFYYTLKKIGLYDIKVINDEWTPECFKFLNNEEIFEPNLDLNKFNPDLIISFDAAWIEQLWSIYENNVDIFNKTNFVCIDHHISNPWFWKINIIDTDSSSTCELVYDIIKSFWYAEYIDSKIATFLLTWIITDTNSFFNSNSSAKALKSAWELMAYAPRHQDIILNLFKKKPFSRLKLWWKVLESLKDINNWKIVWNIIPKSLFIQTWTTNQDISWLVDEFLTTIDWLEVWFIIYELDNWNIKASFRWKSDLIDLSKFCEKWWWWWHSRASWFVISWKNIYEIEQEIIQELKKLV